MPGKAYESGSRGPRSRSKKSVAQEAFSEEQTSALHIRVASLFGEAQLTVASHRKLAVSLRKTQEACLRHGESDADIARPTEQAFNEEFVGAVLQVLCVKKSEGAGDKTMRFIAQFLKHASDCDSARLNEDSDGILNATETPTARLGNQIIDTLAPILTAKEKTVRYRATQTIAHLINSLDAIDDDHFVLLRACLLKRIRDKEAIVRVQAAMGLVRLAGSDDEDAEVMDSDDEEADNLTVKLLDILQNDPSADVRRVLLLNLPLTPTSLPFLLERARDQDPATRRSLYTRLLPALADFRHLSLSMREKLLRWGLRDRDEHVRKATAELFRRRWIEDCARSSQEEDESPETASKSPPSMDALLELLERIDIVNSGNEEGIGKQAMQEFWEGRPDYRDELRFGDSFWNELTPESIFVARTWNDFTLANESAIRDELADDRIPEVTRLAFCLEHYIGILTKALRRNIEEEEAPEETIELEFIVEQLLHIAKTLDYADEIGRRKMFALMRESLSIADLPEEITQLVIDVLRDVCGGEAADERDFCGIVLEIIAEIHDTITIAGGSNDQEDESFHSARSELSDKTPTDLAESNSKTQQPEDEERKAIQEIMINMKCLHIAQCMLQNVEGALQANMHLVNMLNNLVVPAIKSQEAPVRERGLLCLGLCCLIDKNLAAENLTLFAHCFTKGHDLLQITAIQTVSDILESHPSLLTGPDVDPSLQKMIIKMFSKGIKANHAVEVQLEAIVALCKLLLVGVITDEDLLQQAVVSFFDSSLNDNAGASQALSYSLPVYCYSKRANMESMARIAKDVLLSIMELNEDSGDRENTIAINRIGSVLADWTDARKLVIADQTAGFWTEAAVVEANEINGDAHLILAEHLLDRSLYNNCSKDERKSIYGILGKLHVLAGSSDDKLLSVHAATVETMDERMPVDAVSKSALNKFYTALVKVLENLKLKANFAIDDDTMASQGPDLEVGGLEEAERTVGIRGDGSVLDELLDDEDDL